MAQVKDVAIGVLIAYVVGDVVCGCTGKGLSTSFVQKICGGRVGVWAIVAAVVAGILAFCLSQRHEAFVFEPVETAVR